MPEAGVGWSEEFIRTEKLVARIDGREYPVIEVSCHGVRLSAFSRIAPVSSIIVVDFEIPGLGAVGMYQTKAVVAWSGKKETALAFEMPGRAWNRISSMLGGPRRLC